MSHLLLDSLNRMQHSLILEVPDAQAQGVVRLHQVWKRLLFILHGSADIFWHPAVYTRHAVLL